MKKSSLNKKFIRFLLPSVSAMWVFSIYTMVDGIFVGRGVGPLALAAVNLSMPYINLIFGISLLVSIGASTTISISMGRGETQRANELFTMSNALLAASGVVISACSIANLDSIALFLGADSTTISGVKDYLGIIIPFSTFFMVAYSLEVLVKADGFPRYAIMFVGVAAVTNIVFDYVFIMKLGWGIRGAAWATGMSQLISCIGFAVHFVSGRSNLKLSKFRLSIREAAGIIGIGIPEAVTEFSTGMTVFFFNTALLKYAGSQGVAAFGVMMYINNLVIMSMIGINQAMQPLVSFYYGGGDRYSMRHLLGLSFKSVAAVAAVFVVICQVLTKPIVGLFIDPSNAYVYSMSVGALRIFSLSFAICGFNIVVSGYFTAVKHVGKALLVSVMRGMVCTGISVALLPVIFGEAGIWASAAVSELSVAVISASALLVHSRSAAKPEAALSRVNTA